MLDDFGEVFINCKGEKIKLTESETKLLAILILNKEKIVKYEYIYKYLKRTPNAVRFMIISLKKKLQEINIVNVKYKGYYIEELKIGGYKC